VKKISQVGNFLQFLGLQTKTDDYNKDISKTEERGEKDDEADSEEQG
jgi:hypothetical protein